MNTSINSHYHIGHYTTHQPDGVQLSAHFTCGEKLEGIGENESAAMSALWAIFLQHREDRGRNFHWSSSR